MIFLIIAVLGWGLILIYAAKLIYDSTFKLYKNALKIVNEGRSTQGHIISTKENQDFDTFIQHQEIIVSFKNLNGAEVRFPFQLVDTKPQLKRYEIGKTIFLKIDDTLKRAPFIMIEGAEVKLNRRRLLSLTLAWVFSAILIIGYFIFAYIHESNGFGWRFLSLEHPLLMSLGIILVSCLVYIIWIRKMNIFPFLSRTKNDSIQLLFKGVRTSAEVLETLQTGTYINEQPQLRFKIRFTDGKGQVHIKNFKRVVSLIDLHRIDRDEIEIFYLPENPEIIAMKEDILTDLP